MTAVKLSFEEKYLAGQLLSAVAKAMCGIVYNKQIHDEDPSSSELIYNHDRQIKGKQGALFNHLYIASFERIAANLIVWNIVEEHTSHIYKMLLDADTIPTLTLKRTDLNKAIFAQAIEAFLNFSFQPGWPEHHFSKSLISSFHTTGLIEYHHQNWHWSPEMLQYFRYIPDISWSAEDFFRHICADANRQ